MTIQLLAVVLAAAPAFAAPAVVVPLRAAGPAFSAPAAFAGAAASLTAAPAFRAPSALPAASAALPSSPLPSAAPAAVPAAAPAAVPLAVAPAAAPSLASARLRAASAPLPPDSSDSARSAAGASRFDGASAFSAPDAVSGWYDRHTGAWETQTSKIKKAYDLALTHPLASGIKGALTRNTLYRVDNSLGDWHLHTSVRTQGDDPEKTGEADALVIFNHNALVQLSPEFLAAKLASMWVRHLYRDALPASAEKTYVEGSVLIRVFMGLTGSTARDWNGDKDYYLGGTFELYRHFYHWIQGFRFANVRQGPYFLDKIMHAQGDPSIDTDRRGRMTLFQRSQAGEVSPEAAEAAQGRFDGFVSNEQR